MTKPNLKIIKTSLPERCEVCHQSDLFDRNTEFCLRCNDSSLQTNTATDVIKTNLWLADQNIILRLAHAIWNLPDDFVWLLIPLFLVIFALYDWEMFSACVQEFGKMARKE